MLSFIFLFREFVKSSDIQTLAYFKAGYNLTQVRQAGYCSGHVASRMKDTVNIQETPACFLRYFIKKNVDKKNNILLFTDVSDRILYVKMLDFDGYNIDFRFAYSEKLRLNNNRVLKHKYKHVEPVYYIYENTKNPMIK